MKWLIEEYGFSIVSLVIVGSFIRIGHVLYEILTRLSQLHMEGLVG